MERVEIGRTYFTRSGLSGKARRMVPVREVGQRVECIAEDNGKTVIVSRYRLNRDSIVMTDQQCEIPPDGLAELLDKLLTEGR